MSSSTEILKALEILLGKTFLRSTKFIVWYGSRMPGRDNDLLIVASTPQPTSRVILGNLDLIVASLDQFLCGLDYWDPIFTEPLLTGNTILSTSLSWDKLKATTYGKKMSIDCPARLLHIAEKTLRYCKEELRKNTQETLEHMDSILINISWAYSYLGYADIYSENYPICTFKELLEIPKTKYVRDFHDKFISFKKVDSTTLVSKLSSHLKNLSVLIETIKTRIKDQQLNAKSPSTETLL